MVLQVKGVVGCSRADYSKSNIDVEGQEDVRALSNNCRIMEERFWAGGMTDLG